MFQIYVFILVISCVKPRQIKQCEIGILLLLVDLLSWCHVNGGPTHFSLKFMGANKCFLLLLLYISFQLFDLAEFRTFCYIFLPVVWPSRIQNFVGLWFATVNLAWMHGLYKFPLHPSSYFETVKASFEERVVPIILFNVKIICAQKVSTQSNIMRTKFTHKEVYTYKIYTKSWYTKHIWLVRMENYLKGIKNKELLESSWNYLIVDQSNN